jgi:ABC-type transporter Mla subunit MlaD
MNLRVSPIGNDARIAVRLQSTAGGYYLALSRGSYRTAPLRSGAVIPTARDSYTESLPTALRGFSRAALGDLRRSLALTGAGFYDRGLALNEALNGVDATVADTTAVLQAATPGEDLEALTRDGAVTAQALQGSGPDDAGRLTSAAAILFGTLADPASRLGPTIDELPGFERTAVGVLPQLDPLLTRATSLATALQPAVGALQRALPSLTGLLRSGPVLGSAVPPLVQAATPALKTLTPLLAGIAPDSILLTRDLPPIGHLASYVVQFPQEVLNGLGTYYYATLYHAEVGSAPGYAAAAVQLVLTCAPGYNPHPTPGSVYTDRLPKPCD